MPAGALRWSSFTPLDWALVGLVLTSTLLAFRNGLVRTVFSLAGLVVGGVVAAWYYARLAAWLQPWIAGRRLADGCAFFAIWIAAAIVIGLIGALLRKSLAAVGLGLFDRIFGAIFGLLRGVLLGAAIVSFLAIYVPDVNWFERSGISTCLLGALHAVSFVVPAQLKEQLAASTVLLLKHSPEP